MDHSQKLRGFATISFYADDMRAARKWYSELLGIMPYFELLGIMPYFERPDAEHPAYIEFRVGDYLHELGIIDRRYAPKEAVPGPGGAVLFWHVDDIHGTFKRLLAMGAKVYEPIIEREAGFITASVVDPFGNILGIMYNPHYLEVLNKMRAANT